MNSEPFTKLAAKPLKAAAQRHSHTAAAARQRWRRGSGGGATAAAAASGSRLSHCADDDDGDECACAEPSELVIDERRAVAGDTVISDRWLVTQDCQSLSHSQPTIWLSCYRVRVSGQSQDATLPPCC